MSDAYIRIRYAEGETGWAEDLGDGRVKLANCPLDRKLFLGDICSIVKRDGWRCVDEVLESRYSHSATIWYDDIKHFYLITGASTVKDWATEGGLGPKEEREGFFTINYNGKESDLEGLIKLLGLTDRVRITREEG